MHLFSATSILMAAAVSVAACAPAASPEAEALHNQFMINAGRYNSLKEKKALAVCINWDLSTKDRLVVLHAQTYYQPKYERHIDNERGVFRSVNLMSLAIRACKSTRKTSGADCKCQPMDRNGRSALKVPDSFTQ